MNARKITPQEASYLETHARITDRQIRERHKCMHGRATARQSIESLRRERARLAGE